MQNAKEHIICVAPIQMLSHVDASYNRVLMKSPILISGLQLSRLNLERSIVLHSGAGVVDETPIHRIRRLGRYNTSPYITTFESSSGSSSTLSVIFDQKHPFDSISGTHDTSLYINFWKWLREGLLARHQNKDCGLYISAYAEFLSDGNGISIGPFDPDLMRSRYAALLWNYNMLKIQAEAISDSEAPDKPIRSNVDVDSSERITIIQFYYIFFMFV
uniref:Ulp1 protease family, C-terminal catalytic domain containing protein n=1 Tax=Solanum tuberosum TaxID=4113 RepID=M1DWP6_SOLTU